MRIFLWAESFWPDVGGGSVMNTQLVTAMQQRGHSFLIVAGANNQQYRPPIADFHDAPIYRFPFAQLVQQHRLLDIKSVCQGLNELVCQFQPDLIHVPECGSNNFFWLLYHPKFRVPVIHTIQALIPQAQGIPGLMTRTWSRVDWVAAVSQAMLEDARELVPEITACSSLIHNGAIMPTLEPTPLSPDLFSSPHLLYVGRLVREKGVDLLLDAFAQALKKFPRARLTLVGDGFERERLERQAVELGVRRAVEFLGWVSPENTPALINASTLVVVPSRWREPFGLVALEAMQMARPVVASRVGGLAEVVADGETGILIENENSAALADAIACLLEHPDVARVMGVQGRKRAQEKFSIERYADGYEQLYRRLLNP